MNSKLDRNSSDTKSISTSSYINIHNNKNINKAKLNKYNIYNSKHKKKLVNSSSNVKLSSKSWNEIDESWKLLTNVRNKIRGIEEKLNNYSNYKFDTVNLNSSDEEQEEEEEETSLSKSLIQSNDIENKNVVLLEQNKIQPDYNLLAPLSNIKMSSSSNRKTFETTASTIQAGDPSIIIHHHYHPQLPISSTKSVNTSKLSSSVYRHLDTVPVRETQADIRYLNEIPIDNSKKKLLIAQQQQQHQRLNTVDVIIPNEKTMKDKLIRKVKEVNSNNMFFNSNPPDDHNSLMSKERASSMHHHNQQNRLEGTNNNNNSLFLKNRSTSEDPTTGRYLHHEYFTNNRTLHRDTDLLPKEPPLNNDDYYLSKFTNNSNRPAIVTKRHLSSSNNQLSTNDHNLISANNSISLNDQFTKPLNRKIAISNSNLLNKEDSNDSSNLINLLPSSKLNINSIKYSNMSDIGLSGLTAKENKEQIIKRLKRTELLIGDTYADQSGPSKLVPSANSAGTMIESNNQKSNGIITASSWRIGEVLAQKQLKDFHLTAQSKNKFQTENNNQNDLNQIQSKLSDKENESKQSSQQLNKKSKRIECHLISTTNNVSNFKPIATIQSPNEHEKANLSHKSKPYDLTDIHKYMQLQKTKRLYELKSEKEKSKKDDEERKKKLQELYRKQRRQLSNNNDKKINISPNNLFTLSIKNENNEKQHLMSNQDQDMSKMLHDKIIHLLNDNDKLVDKQTKQLGTGSNNKFSSKRNSNKRVDFDTNKIYPLNDDDNLNDVNKSNGSNQNVESSLDYSSSVTITPNTSNLKYQTNLEDVPLLTNSSREPNHSSSYNKHDKHDRLKRICSMALELQTKLHQTKLKLFGYNPNDDSLLENNHHSNLLASTKINDLNDNSGGNGDLKNIDDIFADSREKMTIIEKMFKDNLKEERIKLSSKINNSNSVMSVSSSSNSMSTDLPGSSFKRESSELTRDLAARKIQSAYRLFIKRRQSRNKQITINNKKQGSKLASSQNKEVASNQAKIILTSSNLNKIQTDEYNFINIYRKRVTIESSSNQKQIQNSSPTTTANNNNNNNNNESIKSNKNLSIVSNSSSSSSSSDSTSISKYISYNKSANKSNNSKSNKNTSRKVSKSSDNPKEEDPTSISSSSSSIDITTNQTSSKTTVTSSTSSSSSSSSSSTVTSSSSSSSSNTTSSDIKNIKYPMNSKSNMKKQQHLSSPKNLTSKLKQILDEEQEQKELRYSPSSLERMLSMGINYLDTLNNSAIHLEELDKVRSIGLAQQETVVLASLLKNQTNAITNDFPNSVKNEKILNAKSTRPTKSNIINENNNGSTQSLSSTLSSSSSLASSYNQLNEKENESEKNKATAHNNNTLRKTAKKSDHQDVSTASASSSSTSANTISDMTFEKKNATSGIDDDEEMEKSFRQLLPSESHIKKSKQDQAKLDNKDQSILMDLSHSSFYQPENSNNNIRLSFEDDSFKKFTGEIVKKYMQEEEMRSKHQAHLLKLREKALIDKTNAELAWVDQMKKKVQDKGEDEKMPSILKKEKGIMQKLKEEQENINKMKEVQRKATENRLKILSQHSEVIKWCQNKLKKQASTYLTSNNNNNINNNNNNQDNFDISYNGSEVDYATTEEDEHHNQLEESNINQSLLESKLMKKVKQHLNSEKYLTEREKKLRLRRKHAEEIIAWKKKLDDEELQVREIEKQANRVLTNKKLGSINDKANSTNEKFVNKETKTSSKNGAKSSLIDFEEEVKTESNIIAKTSTNNEKSYSESFASNASFTEQTFNNEIKSKVNKSTLTQSNIITQLDDVEDSTIKTNYIDDETNKIAIRTESPELSESISTATVAEELEFKVKQLKDELIKKKTEAERLRQTLKSKEKLKLREKEEVLRKKINSYDQLIEKIKGALENEQSKTPLKETKHNKKLDEQEEDESSSSSIKSISIRKDSNLLSSGAVGENIKTETIVENFDAFQDHNDSFSSKSSLKKETKKKNFNESKDSISTNLQITNQDESSTSSSSSSTKPGKVNVLLEGDDKYEDDFVNSINSLSKHEQDKDNQEVESLSSSSSSSNSNSTTKSRTEISSNNQLIKQQPNEDLKKSLTNKEDDLISTASEISEEILGGKETSGFENTATNHSLKDKTKSKREQSDEEFDTEEPTSSSSTDTQILLLNRSAKKTEVSIDLKSKDEASEIDDKEEKSQVIESTGENIEIVTPKDDDIELENKQDIKDQIEENNELIESYEALLANQTEFKETQENNNDMDDFKIHIPTIDLSNDDDDNNALQKTARMSDSSLNDSSELVKKIEYKIPFTKEKISDLCDLAIENYYWNQVENNLSLAVKSDEKIMELKENQLKEFFQITEPVNIDEETTTKTEQDIETEFKFKRLIFDLIGELMMDLYVDKYQTPELISELLPSVKKYPKRVHFKGISSNTIFSKNYVKELIKSKVLQILKLDISESEIFNKKTIIKSKWRSQKRLDLVDGLLDSEMREQEHEWANYEQEEYEAKILISNTIFDILIKDAIDSFQDCYLKKHSSK